MASTPFASVKLPHTLVEQARQAAQPMRRSVASQIEYWATLGQIVEHTGLSVQEARSAIEQYGAAPRAQATAPTSVDALTARMEGSPKPAAKDMVQLKAELDQANAALASGDAKEQE